MRRFVTFSAIAALIVVSGLFILSAEAADMPGTVVLDGCSAKQPPVDFNHATHVDRAKCVTCHHTQPDLEAGGEAATCVSCHKDPKDEAPSCAEMSPTKNPYHINCMGCHKDAVKKDASLKGKAPTTCKECHVKK